MSEMAVYDAMPAWLRQMLRDCPIGFRTSDVAAVLDGLPKRQAEALIQRYTADAIQKRADLYRERYGTEYPHTAAGVTTQQRDPIRTRRRRR